MIIDTLAHAEKYRVMHPLFKKAFAFLKKDGLDKLADGRHEILGKDLFAIVVRKRGTGRNKAQLETHRRYIDIQYIVSGTDLMGWKAGTRCRKIAAGFDKTRDYALYSDKADIWFNAGPGIFAVFFPHDAHAPLSGRGLVHKIVVKVALKKV